MFSWMNSKTGKMYTKNGGWFIGFEPSPCDGWDDIVAWKRGGLILVTALRRSHDNRAINAAAPSVEARHDKEVN